jgi:uncharacterized protein
MNRRDALLAVLAAAEGAPYTPVQIQKALFLVARNVPHVVNEGPNFNFVAYDYGPFDSAVYAEARALASDGEAVIAQSGVGRWDTYSASEAGVARGRAILAALDEAPRNYIQSVSSWVRAQTFSGLVRSIYDAYPEMRENSIFQG